MSWTRHGHYIPGTTMSDYDRPPICRCGGIGLCKACNTDAALHWGRMNNKPPNEQDLEQVDYWESFAEQVRASLNIIAEHQVAQVNILEKLFEMVKKQVKDDDEITIDPNPVRTEKVSYAFTDVLNHLKKG